jgi:aminopeptidase N
VPSLLRGFSAPVALVDGLGDEELIVLLAHDPDPFCRWESAQRLALSRLLTATRARVAGETATEIDAPFAEAMRAVLVHPSLDPALKALVLTLPGEGYVAEHLDSVDPPAVHAAREALRRGLARTLRDDWEARSRRTRRPAPTHPTPSPRVGAPSPTWRSPCSAPTRSSAATRCGPAARSSAPGRRTT